MKCPKCGAMMFEDWRIKSVRIFNGKKYKHKETIDLGLSEIESSNKIFIREVWFASKLLIKNYNKSKKFTFLYCHYCKYSSKKEIKDTKNKQSISFVKRIE